MITLPQLSMRRLLARAGSMQRIVAGGVLDKECAMAIYPLYQAA